MKIYIAGKITGLDNHKEKFGKKQKELESMGHTVINPTGLYEILGDDFSHSEYMKICYSLIDLCDCVYFLDNWADSTGATLEKDYAMDNGKDIIYQRKLDFTQSGNKAGKKLRRKQVALKTNNTITNISKVQCDRCGYQSELEISKTNEGKILINRIDAYSVNPKGQKLDEYSNLKYYICDNCWNDLLEFFDSEEGEEK